MQIDGTIIDDVYKLHGLGMMHKFIAGVLLVSSVVLLSACTEEQQNRLSRVGVTWLEGDYKVTFAEGNHQKTWTVKDSKVTSEPQKGYYFFWAIENGKKIYVQTPIARTYIEELR
jgi:outer membrane biogenesis lipoprotein LolB